MIPFATFVSEVSAADLLQQVRWREGLYCPRCQSETVIKYEQLRSVSAVSL